MDADLDPFTKNILERTRARREQLSRLAHGISSSKAAQKRPNILLEDYDNVDGIMSEASLLQDPSKRRCSLSPKQDGLPDIDDNEKENVAALQKYNESHSRSLKFSDKNDDLGQKPITSANTRQGSGLRNRLANLAAQVNTWEDKINNFSDSKGSEGKIFTTNNTALHENYGNDCGVINRCKTKGELNSLSEESVPVSGARPETNVTACHQRETSTNHTRIQSEDKSVKMHATFPPNLGTVKEDGTSFPSKNQQVRTVHEWDKHVLETLQAQGFTKSPSAKKLMYQYSRPVGRIKEATAKFSQAIDAILQEDTEDSGESCVRKWSREPVASQRETASTQDTQEMPNMEKVEKVIDPALLPLAARKALFEQKMGFGEQTNSHLLDPENLPVSERARLFETASKTSKKTLATAEKAPQLKFPSSRKDPPAQTSETETVPVKSPVRSSTRYVQEQLLKSVQNDWRNKETVSKSLAERQKEMQALRNRWEKTSSGQYEKQSSSENKFVRFEEDQSNSESASDDESAIDKQGIREWEEEAVKEDAASESHEVAVNQNAKKLLDGEELQSMDDFVDEAFGDIESYATPPVKKIQSTSPKKENPQPVEESTGTSHLRLYPKLQDEIQEIRDTCKTSELPVIHTISFYRKQKQTNSGTPVKMIVRRELPSDPPSPQKTSEFMLTIQERIRELQQETQAQQVIISQTSQALNLCQATAEHFGSREQLECERLLLIASQKRQAAMNEITRLKTECGLGQHHNLDAACGTMTLSNISLPLKLTFMEARLAGQIGNSVHHFIIIVRHEAQVISTQMISTEDECIRSGALSFTNLITIHGLKAQFEVSLDVYVLDTRKEKVAFKKGTKKLSSKHKRQGTKSVFSPGNNSPASPCLSKTTSFVLSGSVKLTIGNCNRSAFSLDKIPQISPLDGTIRLNVQVQAENQVSEKGFLTMFEDVSGYGSWFRRWCVLTGNELSYWKYPDDVDTKAPIGSIELKYCVTPEVGLVPRDICARPQTLCLLTFHSPNDENMSKRGTLVCKSYNSFVSTKHFLAADTAEERKLWSYKLNQALQHIRYWDPTALRPLTASELEQYLQP